MTQNEFDGMLIKTLCYAVMALLAVWGFFKAFATQKDLDKLSERVDDLEDQQTATRISNAELKTAVRGLEAAVRDLTQLLRRQNNPSCAVTFPHQHHAVELNDGEIR